MYASCRCLRAWFLIYVSRLRAHGRLTPRVLACMHKIVASVICRNANTLMSWIPSLCALFWPTHGQMMLLCWSKCATIEISFHVCFESLLTADVFTRLRLGDMWRWVQCPSEKHDRLIEWCGVAHQLSRTFLLLRGHTVWRRGALS